MRLWKWKSQLVPLWFQFTDLGHWIEVVCNISETGTYVRPLSPVEAVSKVAAAAIANWLDNGPLLHGGGATTLGGKPASSRPWPRAWHRCLIVLGAAALRKLECHVPGWTARRGHGHLGRRWRKLLHCVQHQIRQRHAGQVRVHQDHRLPIVARSSW